MFSNRLTRCNTLDLEAQSELGFLGFKTARCGNDFGFYCQFKGAVKAN